MTKELLILRHGKSDWQEPVQDIDRPLKKRGRENAKLIGLWLVENDLTPDGMVCSPAVRARETASIVCQETGFSPEKMKIESDLYTAYLEDVLGVIRNIPDDIVQALLIGHNFVLEELVMDLTGGDVECPDNGKLMPTAALARFKITGSWSDVMENSANLVTIVRPKEIESR